MTATSQGHFVKDRTKVRSKKLRTDLTQNNGPDLDAAVRYVPHVILLMNVGTLTGSGYDLCVNTVIHFLENKDKPFIVRKKILYGRFKCDNLFKKKLVKCR